MVVQAEAVLEKEDQRTSCKGIHHSTKTSVIFNLLTSLF